MIFLKNNITLCLIWDGIDHTCRYLSIPPSINKQNEVSKPILNAMKKCD